MLTPSTTILQTCVRTLVLSSTRLEMEQERFQKGAAGRRNCFSRSSALTATILAGVPFTCPHMESYGFWALSRLMLEPLIPASSSPLFQICLGPLIRHFASSGEELALVPGEAVTGGFMKRISTDVIGTVGEEMPWLTRRCSSMGSYQPCWQAPSSSHSFLMFHSL